jgi:hypothetical protein
VVLRDGKPVEAAVIRVTAKFAEDVQTTTTDSKGRFSLDPIRRVLFTASLIGDPLTFYSVQITVAGESYDGFSEATVGYAPNAIEVKCDLAQAIHLGPRQLYCSLIRQSR